MAPGSSNRGHKGRRSTKPHYEDSLRRLGAKAESGLSSSDRGANESGLLALGKQVEREKTRRGRHAKRKRWSRKRKIITPILALLVLFCMLTGGGYFYAKYRYDQFKKVPIEKETAQISGQPFNILVIGSDSRTGTNGAVGAGTKTVVPGQRSDVVMIWHVDPATKKVVLMSIPRDTMVQMIGKNATTFGKLNRINASFNNGPTLLVQTIQDNFGIPINHVIEVDFSGFQGAVNALGGVWMNFPYPAKDAYSDLTITHSGCQLLNGGQALSVARSRHYQYEQTGVWQYDGTSDFGRIHRQDAFLKALFNAAKSKYNPFTINAFLGSIPQGITIDTNLSLSDMLGLAETFHGVNTNTIATYTLPTLSIGAVTPWGDVLFVNQPSAQQMLKAIFGAQLSSPVDPPPNTALVPTPPPTTTTTPANPSTTKSVTTTGTSQSSTTSTTAANVATTDQSQNAPSTLASASSSPLPPPTPPPSFDPVPCTAK